MRIRIEVFENTAWAKGALSLITCQQALDIGANDDSNVTHRQQAIATGLNTLGGDAHDIGYVIGGIERFAVVANDGIGTVVVGRIADAGNRDTAPNEPFLGTACQSGDVGAVIHMHLSPFGFGTVEQIGLVDFDLGKEHALDQIADATKVRMQDFSQHSRTDESCLALSRPSAW